MSQQPVTLLDVARAAEVSRTTASAALSGSGRISVSTRDRVRAVAESLGYRANVVARHLRRGRSGVLGVYLPHRVGLLEYYMRFVFGAAQAAREAGCSLTILAAGRDDEVRLDAVDGVLLVDPLSDDPHVADLVRSGLPIISSERLLSEDGGSIVVVEPDHREAVGLLLDHLESRGAHRPAFLGAGTNSSWGLRTAEAYTGWCEARGVPTTVRHTAFTADPAEVARAAVELLDAASPPDAIVSVPDGAALAVLDVLRERRASVLLCAATDSTPYRYVTPGITALDHHPDQLGRMCAELLVNWVDLDVPPAVPSRAAVELVVRAST
ncbi:LacI family DNA-binding transcriptional regulator [Microbacterium sp. P5_E9]